MNRREVIRGVGAAAVAALTPELLLGVATAGGLRDIPADEAELPAFLAQLDDQVARVRASAVAGPLAAHQARLGFPDRLCADLSESMVRISAFRDLPRRLQAHPEMQRRIRRELPRMGQQVLGMAMFLRDLPEGALRDVRRLLRDNPGLRSALRERRLAGLAQLGLPHERVRQTDRLMDHTLFRLERQPTSNLLDELVGKVRRASANAGANEEEWGELVALDLEGEELPDDGTLLFAQEEGTPDEPAAPDEPTAPAVPSASEPEQAPAGERILRKLFTVGAIIAGVGAGIFLVGLLTLVVFENLGGYMTIAGFYIFLLGLIILGLLVIVAVIYVIAVDVSERQASLVLPEELLAAIRAGEQGGVFAFEPATI